MIQTEAIMPDVFTKAKRSEVMSRIRSRGNVRTELRLVAVFRAQGITGWRRHLVVKGEGKSGAGEAGFRVSESQGRGVRGRLFLAWLPEVLCAAEAEPEILGCEA